MRTASGAGAFGGALLGLPSRGEGHAGRVDRGAGFVTNREGAFGRGDSFIQSSSGDAGGVVAAEAPGSTTAESIAGSGHDREVGVRDREVHGGMPVAVAQHDAGQCAGQGRLEAGQTGAHAARERSGTFRRERGPGGHRGLGGIEHQQPRTDVAVGQSADRGLRFVASGHDDGSHRIAERRGHRDFRARFDDQMVHQRPGHAEHALEDGHGLGVARRVECLGQRVGPGLPAAGLGLGFAPARFGRGELRFAAGAGRGG